jgi:hypothetical protein
MRMGIGVTGVYQASEEQRGWLADAYKFLRAYDDEYSKANGFPPSIKLTTVKPSGTLSLLAGVTPGGHPSPAGPYYLRRIRISTGSPLVEVCKTHGYNVEPQQLFDGSMDKSTMVAEFPCSVPETTPIGGNISAVEQLELVKWLQSNWSDNSVSVTIYYKKEELEAIKEWLAINYINNVKTVSFLLYTGHGFIQAPYETISKEEYDRRKEGTTPITSVDNSVDDMDESDGCESGACPVK